MENFFNTIKFKFVQPKDKKYLSYKIYKKTKKYFKKNDTLNLNLKILDSKQRDFLEKIYQINDAAHMSTPATGLMYNHICRNLKKDEVFLNIGAYRGFSTVCGMINTDCEVHSVDNFSEFDGPKDVFEKNFNMFKKDNHFFYEQDYEVFFKSWTKKINFYIYDAHHSYEHQYKNLEIAKEFFTKDTIIYIDDYNDHEVENATNDFIEKYSKEFRILKKQKTSFNMHPTYWNGFILFQKI